MGGPHHTPSLDATGALFAFQKPISVEQAVRTLTAARNMILDGRLRYHRAGLEVPVSVKPEGCKTMPGRLVNLSQGGMLIQTEHRRRRRGRTASFFRITRRPIGPEDAGESRMAGQGRESRHPVRQASGQAATHSGPLAGTAVLGELTTRYRSFLSLNDRDWEGHDFQSCR